MVVPDREDLVRSAGDGQGGLTVAVAVIWKFRKTQSSFLDWAKTSQKENWQSFLELLGL